MFERKVLTIIVESNVWIRDKDNPTTLYLFPGDFESQYNFELEVESIAEYPNIKKLVGPISKAECEVCISAIKSTLADLEIDVVLFSTADD